MLLANVLKGRQKRFSLWLVLPLALMIVQCMDKVSDTPKTSAASDERNPEWLRIDTLIEINGVLINNTMLDSAQRQAEQLLLDSRECGYLIGEAKVLNNMGLIEMYHGNLPEAVDLFARTNTLSKKLAFAPGITTSRANLAMIFDKLGQYEEAIQATKPVVKELIKHKRLDYLPIVYSNLGSYNERLDRQDSAAKYFKLAFEAGQKAEVQLAPGANYRLDHARFFYWDEHPEKFAEECGKVLQTIDSLESPSRYHLETRVYLQLARYFSVPEETDTLQRIAARVEEILGRMDIPESRRNAYNALYIIYDRTGRPDLAASYLSKSTQVKDSLYSPVMIREITDRFHQMELENERAYQSTLKRQMETTKSGTIVLVTILGGVLAIALFLFIRYRYRVQKEEKRLKMEAEGERKRVELLNQNLAQSEEQIEMLRHQTDELHGTVQALEQEKSSVIEDEQRLITISNLRSAKILTNDQWEEFKSQFEEVHSGLFYRLRESYPDITNAEERLFSLLRLNMSSAELGSALGVSPAAVKKSRQRLRKRLQLSPEQSLEDFVSAF